MEKGERRIMPIFKKWSHFNLASVSRETDAYGVYELAAPSGQILYIGEGHVNARLLAHFINGRDPIPGTSLYRVEYTGSKERAEQRERSELRDYIRSNGTCPRFNDRLG